MESEQREELQRHEMVAVLVLMAAPAAACDNGPWEVEFVGKTAQLSKEGRETLKLLARDVRRGYEDRNLLIVFYEQRPTRSSTKLLLAREHTFRRYLTNLHVPASRLAIATTAESPPAMAILEGERAKTEKRNGTVTVEFSVGCNG
ncbi:hypothetical protein [Sphingomonas sp. MS122]|uniref:hypothetical protein n=1 Tax=Sphingomonas sp. MS122 TaxID=3412683 RepID=UPI003C2EF2E9